MLKGLGIRKAVFEPQFTCPNGNMFTERLKKRLTYQGHQGWYGALAEAFGGTMSV